MTEKTAQKEPGKKPVPSKKPKEHLDFLRRTACSL